MSPDLYISMPIIRANRRGAMGEICRNEKSLVHFKVASSKRQAGERVQVRRDQSALVSLE